PTPAPTTASVAINQAILTATPEATTPAIKPLPHTLHSGNRWLKLSPATIKSVNDAIVAGDSAKTANKDSIDLLLAPKKERIRTVIYKIKSNSGQTSVAAAHIPNPDLTLPKQELPPNPTKSQLLLKKIIAKKQNSAQATTAKTVDTTLNAPKLNKQPYERVQAQLAWYAQHSDYLSRVAERATPYLFHIVETLRKHQLPMDLALLPIVESAYQANAVSPKSAAGIWQFIPTTGLDFALNQDEVFDARYDIPASTRAAAEFLGRLNKHFNGDWLLSLAAYNCGQATVDNAIAHNKANGLATDYWSLTLPQETQDYVPKFLAVTALFANPEHYKLRLPKVKNEPYFITVTLKDEATLNYLAKQPLTVVSELSGINPQHLLTLNPGYQKQEFPEHKPIQLHLPIAQANQLQQRLQRIQHPELKQEAIELVKQVDRPNFNPWSNANDTQLDWLATINPSLPFLSLDTDNPVSPLNTAPKDKVSDRGVIIHYVDANETLSSIAIKFGVSEKSIRSANQIPAKQTPMIGQELVIPNEKQASILFNKPAKLDG
ncbi:transglycosylase SLT domain-containing protein, partial [Methylocucumis oryzae]|uniref:transglycosylase SLT domain-containing protein n=1 Tax=Methylocucumis oryzae TaxID=1632867 RepID=UPI00069835D7